ncbi:hypothetical protein [Rubripirellula reticaptiva]|uniref:UDP-N-acetyl-D-glucosamine 6-dehydrogenase n=1 Tax=Rubripirellula reticaptiva TaxID=2528013 RepID=A0A5C6F290_9BACT|nr:hypothetical protein [Rubripirellula reticaptiva]TWU55225.1 UDP-N-acetyl-D-glucosamine 6-dehydrogenase [Rubripirellula reticaptiva]
MSKQVNQIALAEKLTAGTATVGVVGLGYVGLPLVLAYSSAKHSTIGFDIDDTKVDAINRSESYIKHITC